MGFLLLTGTMHIQGQALDEGMLLRSHSGQFLVSAQRSFQATPTLSTLETNRAYLAVDPTVLPVSCERIKSAVWKELGISGNWQGKILLSVTPALSADDPITVLSEGFRDRWQYRVIIPQLVQRTRYLRAIVQVLLLEIANREAKLRTAEVPAWLVEGLCQQILSQSEVEIMLESPGTSPTGVAISPLAFRARKLTPLEELHKVFGSLEALSFEDLSWPKHMDMDSEAGESYRASAYLFVHSLLKLPGGRACVARMLRYLPQFQNWQFAFLSGFEGHFGRIVDVEKWWALQVVHFTSRDIGQTWTPEQSWKKLEEWSRLTVRSERTSEAPEQTLKLQQVLTTWEIDQQVPFLHRKANALVQLRVRSAPEVLPYIDTYQIILRDLLLQAEAPEKQGSNRRSEAYREAAEVAVRRLDEVEGRLSAMHKSPDPIQAAAIEALRAWRPPTPQQVP